MLLSSQCPQCRAGTGLSVSPASPVPPPDLQLHQQQSPHGDIGVVTWPSGKEQMGTRYIQWFSIWLWVQAGVFWFVLLCSCIEWVYSQMRELF